MKESGIGGGMDGFKWKLSRRVRACQRSVYISSVKWGPGLSAAYQVRDGAGAVA